MADRIYINNDYKAKIDALKQKGILGIDNTVDNKEIFELAVALGCANPKTGQFQYGYVRNDYLKAKDKAILSSLLLGEATTDVEINNNANLEKCILYCQKCAESGFEKLFEYVDEANDDNSILEKRWFALLDYLFDTNVEPNNH